MGFFELLAECSVTFAGFAAVFAVLRGSTGPRGSFRAYSTVTQGFLAFALSLVPILLQRSGIEDPALWRVSSLIGAVGVAAAWASQLIVHHRLNQLGHPAQSTINFRIGIVTPGGILLLLLSNAAGWPLSGHVFSYALAIVLTLVVGIIPLLLAFWLPMREVPTDEAE